VFRLNHAWDWATINFLGSSVTMLAGAWAAMLLRGRRSADAKLKILGGAPVACILFGLMLQPVNPIIHKAWTASFTFIHVGCVLIVLAVFFWLFDKRGLRGPAFPLVVVGMNSIFIYMLWQLLHAGLDRTVGIFTGRFAFAGAIGPAVQACAVALVMWYACYWLYQRRIFLKL